VEIIHKPMKGRETRYIRFVQMTELHGVVKLLLSVISPAIGAETSSGRNLSSGLRNVPLAEGNTQVNQIHS
jgi:hypothetical protein